MAIPFGLTGKFLKKKHAKAKPMPTRGKKVMPKLKAPLFTPPGMDKETMAEGKMKNEERE